jgi:hypothetical protein
MIDKLNIKTSFLPIYKATVKIFVNYIIVEALIRDLQIKKLQETAANKKKAFEKDN